MNENNENKNKMIAFFKAKVAADTQMDPELKATMYHVIDQIDRKGLDLYNTVVEKTGPGFALVLLESALQHGLARTPVVNGGFATDDADFANGGLDIPDVADPAFADAVRAG